MDIILSGFKFSIKVRKLERYLSTWVIPNGASHDLHHKTAKADKFPPTSSKNHNDKEIC